MKLLITTRLHKLKMPFKKIKQSNKKKNIIESPYDPRCPAPCWNDKPHYMLGYGCSICEVPPIDPPSDPESDDETVYQPYKPQKIYKNVDILRTHLLEKHNLQLADDQINLMSKNLKELRVYLP